MGTKFTQEQFEQRIDMLYAFAREQGFCIIALGPGSRGRHHYLVLNGENFLEVSLTSMGGFLLSTEQGMGSQGRISPRLLAWLKQQGLRYESEQPFSRLACEYLSGVEHDAAIHAPRMKRPVVQEGRLEGGSEPLIRQLIPAQPGWCAVYATLPPPREGEDGFEMLPVVGWALVDDESLNGGSAFTATGVPAVVALHVWPTVSPGSKPDASPHFVLHDRSGFLGYTYPGCSSDWKGRAASHRKTAYDDEAEDWKA
jgi:hypothetical protein